jgi:UDP-N-acetylglucosamine 2-epimerase
MRPLSPASADKGFPRPALTLVFDEYAGRHLKEAGAFPAESVSVTGSPRLDVLAAKFAASNEDHVSSARAAAGSASSTPLVLLVTKYSEVRAVLPRLLDAFNAMPDVQLAIKTHPAETPEPYERTAAGIPNVRVLPASADLAPLLRASRAIITVNSTVALDALSLGVPSLSIGLPNNLSPFVAAGAIAGADASADLEAAVRRLVYDEEFRQQLSATASAVVAEYRMSPDGRAAERCASAVLGLARPASRMARSGQ